MNIGRRRGELEGIWTPSDLIFSHRNIMRVVNLSRSHYEVVRVLVEITVRLVRPMSVTSILISKKVQKIPQTRLLRGVLRSMVARHSIQIGNYKQSACSENS